MEPTTKLNFGERELELLTPKIDELLSNEMEEWSRAVRACGIEGVVYLADDFESDISGSLKSSINLPPFLRLGNLRLEQEAILDSTSLKELANYLERNPFPALLNFRDKSAVLNFSPLDQRRLARFTERYFLQLVTTLSSNVIKCTAIDLQNFGNTFNALAQSIPQLEMITDESRVSDFFRELPKQVEQRNKTRGFKYEYLYQYNCDNPDNTSPYHFVFISSVENDLNEDQREVFKRLIQASNAARAGIYFFVLASTRRVFDDLIEMPSTSGIIEVENQSSSGYKIELLADNWLDTQDEGPSAMFEIQPDNAGVEALSQLSNHCRTHLEFPRAEKVKIDLPSSQTWETDAWKESAADGIEVPIGKCGGNLLSCRLGNGESVYHALIGGATGTGKTVMLHAIITQLLAKYSPEEVRISLLDYKGGTEFSIYERVPHLFALSIGHGTKFGADLLQYYQEELTRRADQFKVAGDSSNIANYRKNSGKPMSRHVIIIDEFQVLLQSEQFGQNASQALEDLVRRGRSFGFTLILSSQTLLDGSLPRPVSEQLGCRICLRLSERDCADFLSYSNMLPAKFDRPGQAVYNDGEGSVDQNREFQGAYYSEKQIKEFIALLKEKSSAAACMPANSKPHIYRGDRFLEKSSIDADREHKQIVLAIEEGIPNRPLAVKLNGGTGPIIGIGTGQSHELFMENLIDEIKNSGVEHWRNLEEADIDVFCAEFLADATVLDKWEVLILQVGNKHGKNIDVQSMLTTLNDCGRCKVFVFSKTETVIKDLYLDNEELLFCFDRTSYLKRFTYPQLPFNANSGSAVVQEYGAEWKTVKIPSVNGI